MPNPRGSPLGRPATFVGEVFAPGWSDLDDEEVASTARIMALNLVTMGAEIVAFRGDADRAELQLRGYPPMADAAFFGITPEVADELLRIFVPISVQLGLHVSWQRDGETVRLTIVRDRDRDRPR
jgi:hypothetical protein